MLREEGGLKGEAVTRVSDATGVPEAEIWGAGSFYGLLREPGPRLRICAGLSCRIAGSDELLGRVRQEGAMAEAVSCLGQCDRAPVALSPRMELLAHGTRPRGITPHDPDLPINLGGQGDPAGDALDKARSLGPEQLLAELESSGLQGRGGAGFLAHTKWRSVRDQVEEARYVVLNADEGEPGTFKDREVLLRRPHLVIEGLTIAAEVIGAREIYIYIRGEFVEPRRRLEAALREAEAYIGPLSFHLHEGQGAYICGEETALIESMEGKRGMPRLKPPFPTQVGFRGRPTLIHNVETIACVPDIVMRGGARFAALGRDEPGTKLYCISGHVARPGVYELALGVTLDELVDVAGGYDGTPLAFSPGGASSGFLPMTESTRPLDFGSLAAVGSMLGSAGVVVLNDTVDIPRLTAIQLAFFEQESCGQCAPCRIGTRYLRRQLDEYLTTGDPAAFKRVDDVAWEMEEGSICGLGMAAAKPLISARAHFPDAFIGRDDES